MQQNLGPLSQHPHPGPSHHPAPPEPKARLSGSAGAVHMGGREGGWDCHMLSRLEAPSPSPEQAL